MKTKLIGLTQVIDEELLEAGINTAEDLVAYCARVSNPKNQLNTATAAKLLAYLQKHKHWSPFEMVNLVFEIKTSRDISRQILRHKSFSFQEFSGRYSSMLELNKAPLREMRLQHSTNRQASVDSIEDTILETYEWEQLQATWVEIQDEIIEYCTARYEEALDMGIAKEQARALLPEGLTPTTLYMSGSLRSWIHWYEIRSGEETQKEHRLIAQEIREKIWDKFPSLRIENE